MTMIMVMVAMLIDGDDDHVGGDVDDDDAGDGGDDHDDAVDVDADQCHSILHGDAHLAHSVYPWIPAWARRIGGQPSAHLSTANTQ